MEQLLQFGLSKCVCSSIKFLGYFALFGSGLFVFCHFCASTRTESGSANAGSVSESRSIPRWSISYYICTYWYILIHIVHCNTCTIHQDYIWTNAAHMLSTLRHAENNLPTFWTTWCSQCGIVSKYIVYNYKKGSGLCIYIYIYIFHVYLHLPHNSTICEYTIHGSYGYSKTSFYIHFLNYSIFHIETFPLATEVKVANRVWCLPPGMGVVPEVQSIFKSCIEMDGLCLRRDPGSPSENGFVEPQFYAFWRWLDTRFSENMTGCLGN